MILIFGISRKRRSDMRPEADMAGQKVQFNGVRYRRFADIPGNLLSSGYAASSYVAHFRRKCRILARASSCDPALIRLAGLIDQSASEHPVAVVDYGGGLGQYFYAARRLWRRGKQVTWQVVDVPAMIVVARRNRPRPRGLRFMSGISTVRRADLVFFRQSLQVIDDYPSVLRDLTTRLRPRALVFSGVPAGSNPDYVTLAILAGERGIPCHVVNEPRFLRAVERLGYRLASRLVEKIRIDLSNFPAACQLDARRRNRVSTYIFLRTAPKGEQ